MELEHRRLGNSSVEVTSLALGTVQLGYNPHIRYEQARDVIASAHRAGIRYFDSAPMYGFGRAEYTLGQALAELDIRHDVVVSTKVGRVLDTNARFEGPAALDTTWFLQNPGYRYDYGYDGIMRSFESSLARTGLEHIDVLLVHDLGHYWHRNQADTYWRQFHNGGYRALEELRSSGRVSAIGLGVNETEVVVAMAREFEIDCAMIAGRYTLLNHNPLTGHFAELQQRNVSVLAAGAFNSGVLALGARHPRALYDYGAVTLKVAARVGAIEAVCAAHGVAMSAAALQFTASHPAVATLVFGAQSQEEVRQNVAAASQTIPTVFWAELKQRGLLPTDAPVPGDEATARRSALAGMPERCQA